MPYAPGVQRPRPLPFARTVVGVLAATAFALTAQLSPASPAVSTVAADGAALKAVFIVGPAHGMTDSNLLDAERMARQAEAVGMDVRRVFFPHATWDNVLASVQGANLVVYMGHGYGWPSPYTAKLTESRQNGMGLNSFDGSGRTEYTYYGATPIRQNIRLAPNAVVMLMHACYTAGNGESGMPIPSPDLARERVDNFANGFLAAGAAAVFALAWGTRVDYPRALTTTDVTIDGLFMSPDDHVGWNDMYFDSLRTPGAVNHLDPSPDSGYHRAVTGRLGMTTAEWRSGAGQIVPPPPPPDGVPLMTMAAPTKLRIYPSDSDALLPSTTLKINLGVPAPLNWRVLDASGEKVRTIRSGESTPAGARTFVWDGRSDAGEWLPEGWYRSVATAETSAGEVTLERSVFVGAFQIIPSTTTPVRGVSFKLKLVSTEPLMLNPTVQITQPGLAPTTTTAIHITGRKYKLTVTLSPSPGSGQVQFLVTGTDRNGAQQSSSLSLPLD